MNLTFFLFRLYGLWWMNWCARGYVRYPSRVSCWDTQNPPRGGVPWSLGSNLDYTERTLNFFNFFYVRLHCTDIKFFQFLHWTDIKFFQFFLCPFRGESPPHKLQAGFYLLKKKVGKRKFFSGGKWLLVKKSLTKIWNTPKTNMLNIHAN